MGGKAFEGITQRIEQRHVALTVKWLAKNWPGSKIQGGDFMEHVLGSAGKNETSGDIDLNLRIELYDQAVVAAELIALLGEDHVKPRPGNNQIFTAVPINGNPTMGYVQVDFMFGNYEWQKFSYYSPEVNTDKQQPRYRWGHHSDKSQVKGLFRTELIKALVAFNSDWVLEEDGEMIARVGPTFFHDKGCVWRYRHRPMRKDGTARVKELKELTEAEFLAIYPSASKARTDVLLDPTKVVEMILGDHYQVGHANTFEYLWACVRANYNAEDLKLITKIYLERLNSLKVEIPTDIFRYHGIKVN